MGVEIAPADWTGANRGPELLNGFQRTSDPQQRDPGNATITAVARVPGAIVACARPLNAVWPPRVDCIQPQV